ncbi:MAG: hypothetical protein H6740_26010 [Alphaproteobacteria bacterium]|nr:hypothetical protein [Alphaproteobacteria bacterium]
MPKGAALGAAVATLLIGLLAQALVFALAMSDTPGVAQHGITGEVAWGSTVCVGPVWVLGLGLAALLERRPLARASLLSGGALACAAVGVAVFLGQTLDGEEPGLALFSGLLCGMAPSLALLGLAGLSANRWGSLLAEGRDPDALAAAHDALDQEGHLDAARLQALSGLSAEQCARTLSRMAQDAPETLALDEPTLTLLRCAHLDQARQRLPGVLAAHAELSLGDLGAQLEVPEGQLRELVYAAFAQGELHGATVNWKRGVLRSVSTQAGQPCPACGAALEVVGKGTLECGHCGAEVFL